MKFSNWICGICLLALFTFQGCSVSLNGVQVDTNLNTFSVEYIPNSARLVVPTLSQEMTDLLTQKVFQETRLKLDPDNPDVIFSGEITTYEVASEAPTAGQTTQLNRLDIVVKIEFTNNKDEEANWSSTFSNFSNFDPNENLADVQDDLIAVILKDIVEDIYQKAFTNW